MTSAQDNAADPFSELLDLLGINAEERVSICSQRPDRRDDFDATVPLNRADAKALAASTPYVEGRDVWFGVNPVDPTRLSPGQRGGDEHVTRCVALFADVDIKSGGVSDAEVAQTVTQQINAALGQSCAAVVFTGHGGQPYWPTDPEDDAWTLDTEAKRADAAALYRRFHRLCADIASKHGGSVDNVGQLSRILRVPGTFNRKDPADPTLVKLHVYPFGTDGPLSFAEVLDALDVPEHAEDRERLGAVVCEPQGWQFGEQTTPYVAAMVTGWMTDTPGDGVNLHNWLVRQATRLACAHRLGRITEDDHGKAVETLVGRFDELLGDHGHPRRPTPNEAGSALAWGVRKTASFTDDRRTPRRRPGRIGRRRRPAGLSLQPAGMPGRGQ